MKFSIKGFKNPQNTLFSIHFFQDSHLRGDKIIDSDISSETVIKYTCADGHLVLVTSQQEGENGVVKTFSKTKLSRE